MAYLIALKNRPGYVTIKDESIDPDDFASGLLLDARVLIAETTTGSKILIRTEEIQSVHFVDQREFDKILEEEKKLRDMMKNAPGGGGVAIPNFSMMRKL